MGAPGLSHRGLQDAVRAATAQMRAAGVASPGNDARLLAEHLLGRPPLLADGAGPGFLPAYQALVLRRTRREPLQHILGRMWFRGLELGARPGVFSVRPETEVVAGAAIGAVQQMVAEGLAAPLVVDLCAGSGAIAAAVAVEAPTARVVAVELSDSAVALARDNCGRLAPGRVEVVRADATDPTTLAGLEGQVDVVVSNPPYVPQGAVEDVETARHDPDLALFGGGADGLRLPLAVLCRAASLLRPGGVVVMEHDPGQSQALRERAHGLGLVRARTGTDLTGRERYLRAAAPSLLAPGQVCSQVL